MTPDPLTAAVFVPHVDTAFAIDDGGDAVEATLVEVRQLEGHDESIRRPFVLLFRGPREPVLPQRTYEITHAQVGTHEIFIVPVESNDAGTLYEAVFN
jgi:hypothetical protein